MIAQIILTSPDERPDVVVIEPMLLWPGDDAFPIGADFPHEIVPPKWRATVEACECTSIAGSRARGHAFVLSRPSARCETCGLHRRSYQHNPEWRDCDCTGGRPTVPVVEECHSCEGTGVVVESCPICNGLGVTLIGQVCVSAIVPIVRTPNHGPRSEPPVVPCISVDTDHRGETRVTYWWHHDAGFRELLDTGVTPDDVGKFAAVIDWPTFEEAT